MNEIDEIDENNNIDEMSEKDKSTENEMNDEDKSDKNEWMCDECPQKFKFESELHNHTKKYHDKTEVLCPHCGILIVGKRNLLHHIRGSHEMAKCNKCNIEMKKKNIKRHLLRCSNDDVSLFSCSECDYKTPRKDTLSRHIKLHHAPEFKCDKCDFSTKDKNLLGNHKRYKHSPTKAQKDPEIFFKCSWCPYQSKRKANLERHIGKCQAKKRIEPLNMVPFSKEELGKIFSETDCTATDFNVILR